MRTTPPTIVKDCQMCGRPMERLDGERSKEYLRRRHCSVECRTLMARLRHGRFPFQPLYDYLASIHSTDSEQTTWLTNAEVGNLCGVSSDQVARWRVIGLSQMQADRTAIRLGWHPAWIWPEWVTDCLEAV